MLEDVPTVASRDPNTRATSWRRVVFRHLESAEENDATSRIIDISLILLIVASVVAVLLESIPAVEDAYGDQLYWFEVFTITIFTIEYLLRLWSCVEDDAARQSNPAAYRLKYIFSFHAVIDLLAILPFYLIAFGFSGPFDMRVLRAFRLVRILKLTRYFAALDMLFVAIRENSRALGASFLILITVIMLAATGMYYFERAAQPEDFASIPAAMWWAFATLTTVGYGDVTPITVGGKIFASLISVVGIGMVALPTSILASGYGQQLKLRSKQYRVKADEALDDGILSDDELRDLEDLRVDLGLGKHTASQILDEGMVRAALDSEAKSACCPHCGELLP